MLTTQQRDLTEDDKKLLNIGFNQETIDNI